VTAQKVLLLGKLAVKSATMTGRVKLVRDESQDTSYCKSYKATSA
jgi:hypothetical protein